MYTIKLIIWLILTNQRIICYNLYMERKQKHIVSLSGGKDSTAMVLIMIEKGMHIDEIVCCDTGMEFPEMYDHIKKLEDYINKPITILKAKYSFEYYLGKHVKKNGQIGYGFPDFRNRWCTTLLKQNIMRTYCRGHIEYHGIALDEKHRAKKNKTNRNIRYPLVDWKITEKQALEFCYKKGFKWNGLYEKFKRVSCWCCPLSRLGELKTLYFEYPKLWAILRRLDTLSYRQFRSDYSVKQLEQKFNKENMLLSVDKQ